MDDSSVKWAINKTFLKGSAIAMETGKIPKNHHKVQTLNALPFEKKKEVFFVLICKTVTPSIPIFQFQHLIDKVFHNWELVYLFNAEIVYF